MTENTGSRSRNRIEQEYEDIVKKNAWPILYQQLGLESQRHRPTYDEARKPKNKHLNRYRDVNPYDHSRVILQRIETDYINANFVKSERANRRYILTQGPLAYTTGHFWLMIWEQNTKAILMLNKIMEKGEVKCHWYWPQLPGEDNKLVFDDVKLSVTLVSQENCNYFRTRVLRVCDLESASSKVVVHFHYFTWPDFGVPTSPVAFLRFLQRVRESGVLESPEGPPVVHCSAGIGRSGTFCLVDCALVIAEKEGVENLNVQELLLEMRKDRMGLIQTPDQLRFSYQAIIEGVNRLDPNFVEEDVQLEEDLYTDVGDDEAPPPLPPRAESLTRAPARPLPAIPTSESLGNFNLAAPQESSSDECPPTPPVREEEGEPAEPRVESSGESTDTVRQRRNRELADRVSSMKKRAREAERWQALKRSLYTPLTITFGFLLAGIVIYAYVKH